MVEAADEQTAILRATAHFRRLGHYIHEAKVFKKKDEQLNEFFASKETNLGSIVKGSGINLDNITSLDTPEDESVGDIATDIALSFVPYVGQGLAARDIERARRAGDTTGVALGVASLIPGAKIITKGGKLLKKIPDIFKKVPPVKTVPRPGPVPPTQPRPDQFPVPIPGRVPVPVPRPMPRPQPRPQPEPLPNQTPERVPTPERGPQQTPKTRPQPRSPNRPFRPGIRPWWMIRPDVDVDVDLPGFTANRGDMDIGTLRQYRGGQLYPFHQFNEENAKNAIGRVLAKRKQATKDNAEGEANKINMEPKLTPAAGSKI